MMRYKRSMQIITFCAIIALVAVAAWLTETVVDPCATPQNDISASVLADGNEDQDGLISRAIIIKANCEKE